MKILSEQDRIGIINHSFSLFKSNIPKDKVFVDKFNSQFYLEKIEGLNDTSVIEKILFSEFEYHLQDRCDLIQINQIIDFCLKFTDCNLDKNLLEHEVIKSGLQGQQEITAFITSYINDNTGIANVIDPLLLNNSLYNFISSYGTIIVLVFLTISICTIGFIVYKHQAALELTQKSIAETHEGQSIYSNAIKDISNKGSSHLLDVKDLNKQLYTNSLIQDIASNNIENNKKILDMSNRINNLEECNVSTYETMSKLKDAGVGMESKLDDLDVKINKVSMLTNRLLSCLKELKVKHEDIVEAFNSDNLSKTNDLRSIFNSLRELKQFKDGSLDSVIEFLNSEKGAEIIKFILNRNKGDE